jgi:hypothetical protein
MGRARTDPWPLLEEAAKIGLYSLDFYSEIQRLIIGRAVTGLDVR